MSELYHILQTDPRVQDAVIALGDQDEEVHWAVAAKQLGADGKRHRVYLALTHREYISATVLHDTHSVSAPDGNWLAVALYVFDRDERWAFVTGKWGGRLHCRRRLSTSTITQITQVGTWPHFAIFKKNKNRTSKGIPASVHARHFLWVCMRIRSKLRRHVLSAIFWRDGHDFLVRLPHFAANARKYIIEIGCAKKCKKKQLTSSMHSRSSFHNHELDDQHMRLNKR
jgi:hypothetical protein